MNRHCNIRIESRAALLLALCVTVGLASLADNSADAVMFRKPKKAPAPERSFLLDVAPVKEVKDDVKVKDEVKAETKVKEEVKKDASRGAAETRKEDVSKDEVKAEVKVKTEVKDEVKPALTIKEVKPLVSEEAETNQVAATVKAAKKGEKKEAKEKPPARDAIITADRTDYDRKEGVVLFDRNVHVDDTQYQMHADKLFLFLEGTNELKRLVAIGHVAITNEDKRAYCARATFNKKLGRVVMYSSDEITAELREEGKKGSDVRGERITFWLDSEQVEVDNPIITMPGGIGGQGSVKKLIGK
jgi:lipopolysaccharide transport protein LptA